jgi:hypothetical protein
VYKDVLEMKDEVCEGKIKRESMVIKSKRLSHILS